jgi:hypothetical protein
VWTGEVGSLQWPSRQALGAHQRALGAQPSDNSFAWTATRFPRKSLLRPGAATASWQRQYHRLLKDPQAEIEALGEDPPEAA